MVRMSVELPPRDSALWQDWLTFLRAYKSVVEQISQDLAEHGLPSLIEYSVLFWLSNAEEQRLRQVDLSHGVLVSKSRVTRLMHSLVDQGYVRREKVHSDKRVTYAVLTDRGMEALQEATPTFTAAFNSYFASRIDPDDHGEIARLLSPMSDEYERPPELSRYR